MRIGDTNFEVNSIHVSDKYIFKASYDVPFSHPADSVVSHYVPKVSRSSVDEEH